MSLTRRDALRLCGAGVASAALGRRGAQTAGRGAQFRVGVTDWNLKLENKPEAVALAQRIGFDGVQISLGHTGDDLPLSDPTLQKTYLAESARVGLPLASACLEVLHKNVLKSDPLGQRWVADSIPIARALGVKVVLLPFFGKGALETQAEKDRVGDLLRELAPPAEKAGVVLGLEDTISARDNARIMSRTKSPAVLTYYDVGNSTRGGFPVVEEIRWLGADRICEVHLKDNPHFLGQGPIDFPAVVGALADIGFRGWAQLETDCPTGSVEKDMAANLAYIRGVMQRRS
ncbi:MAG: sugar phosphate isomerase/epimerase [Acidobacteria bacterium]|nr:MAG: sugar phosphate isomerase/epimerase [Acidobacteriota bacterium]PYQ21018.1 MAG: sugar phosphate isomerase/epimerase [Acidobacteriota bacterium]